MGGIARGCHWLASTHHSTIPTAHTSQLTYGTTCSSYSPADLRHDMSFARADICVEQPLPAVAGLMMADTGYLVSHSLGQAVMAAHVPSRPSTFDPTPPPEIVPELHLQAMLHSRRLVPRKPQCIVSQPNMSSRRPSTDQPPSYRPREPQLRRGHGHLLRSRPTTERATLRVLPSARMPTDQQPMTARLPAAAPLRSIRQSTVRGLPSTVARRELLSTRLATQQATQRLCGEMPSSLMGKQLFNLPRRDAGGSDGCAPRRYKTEQDWQWGSDNRNPGSEFNGSGQCVAPPSTPLIRNRLQTRTRSSKDNDWQIRDCSLDKVIEGQLINNSF